MAWYPNGCSHSRSTYLNGLSQIVFWLLHDVSVLWFYVACTWMSKMSATSKFRFWSSSDCTLLDCKVLFSLAALLSNILTPSLPHARCWHPCCPYARWWHSRCPSVRWWWPPDLPSLHMPLRMVIPIIVYLYVPIIPRFGSSVTAAWHSCCPSYWGLLWLLRTYCWCVQINLFFERKISLVCPHLVWGILLIS